MFAKQLRFSIAGMAAALLMGATFARAVPMNYGNFSGTSIDFLDVTEDSATDPTPLYGAPTVAGNGISFSPTSAFSATSSNGGADITDGKLTTTLMTTAANARIEKVSIQEFGDYTLTGTGTAATAASVGAPVFLTVLALDNVNVTPIPLPGAVVAMSPSGGTYDLVNDAGVGVPWVGSLTVDVTAELAALGYAGQRATKIAFEMDNSLAASSEAGTIAFIAKKGINAPLGTTIEVIIPEPSSIALAGIALAGLAVGWRRRR